MTAAQHSILITTIQTEAYQDKRLVLGVYNDTENAKGYTVSLTISTPWQHAVRFAPVRPQCALEGELDRCSVHHDIASGAINIWRVIALQDPSGTCHYRLRAALDDSRTTTT